MKCSKPRVEDKERKHEGDRDEAEEGKRNKRGKGRTNTSTIATIVMTK